MNVKLNYLYRDNSNYKQYGFVVYSNSNNLSIEVIRDAIFKNLIEGEFFNAEKWGVPEVFFESNTKDDHEWHELEGVELSNDMPGPKEIDELLRRFVY